MGARKTNFQLAFALLPTISCGLIPTLLFGSALGQWGSNLIWGSYFGLGWCLAAFGSSGIVHDQFSTTIGIAWGWLAMIPLYSASGWLWKRLSESGRCRALILLLLSLVPMLPAKVLLDWDAAGIHLPDYMAHLASSY